MKTGGIIFLAGIALAPFTGGLSLIASALSLFQHWRTYDAQTILSTAIWALWSLLRTLTILLGLAVALAAVFALVAAFWLPICQVAGALSLIAAFGWATYPRRKAVL